MSSLMKSLTYYESSARSFCVGVAFLRSSLNDFTHTHTHTLGISANMCCNSVFITDHTHFNLTMTTICGMYSLIKLIRSKKCQFCAGRCAKLHPLRISNQAKRLLIAILSSVSCSWAYFRDILCQCFSNQKNYFIVFRSCLLFCCNRELFLHSSATIPLYPLLIRQ